MRLARGSVREGHRAVPWALILAGVGVASWVLIEPRTPDLAGQVYRANLFRQVGFGVWDERWYAGHHLPGYSVTSAPLAALLGIRTVGALAVLCSVWLFERIARIVYGAGREVGLGVLWFAVAALGDLWIGRITFALGVSLGLASVLVLAHAGRSQARHGRRGGGPVLLGLLAAAGLAALCAASSPVAGGMLVLAALTQALATGSPRALLVAGGPAAVVVGALAGLFPEGGTEPFPTLSFMVTIALTLAFLAALPRDRRVERVGARVYLGVCAACLLLDSPMGSNIERYGVLLGGAVLLCCLGTGGEGERWQMAPGRRIGVSVALCGLALWSVWGPVREVAVAGRAPTAASYYAPVVRFMASHGGAGVRVEVPFTRGHWEAAWLAPTISLARGWERQLDSRYDEVLLRPGLTPGSYRTWLDEQAVGYVALPDAQLDPSSSGEGVLIRSGLSYLREVFAGGHWRIYEVLDPRPMLEGPGRLLHMGHDWFTLRARAAGAFLVRVRYTRYWTVAGGGASVGRGVGGWTLLKAPGPGDIRVEARFSL